MKFAFTQSTLQGTVRQKNLLLWTCLGLTAANMLLVICMIRFEEHWVLVPQNDVNHQVPVTSTKYSDPYFIGWASHIVHTLLCVNPDSVDWKTHQILEITVEKYGHLKEKFQKEAQRIKLDQISTVFYPKHFNVNQATQTIEIRGTHLAYFGKDSEPIITEKTFRLSWVIREHGLVFLKDFTEVTHES